MTTPRPPLPSIPCPLCDNCEHDIRDSLMLVASSITSHFNEGVEHILDGMEATSLNPSVNAFTEAMVTLMAVRDSINGLLDTIPEMTRIKIAHTA